MNNKTSDSVKYILFKTPFISIDLQIQSITIK